jgi:hypothetical protein
MSQDMSSTILYICAVYKQKYAVRIRNAKKVRHRLRAAAHCTGGHMPGAPLPGLPRQGKERQAVRATSPRRAARCTASLHGARQTGQRNPGGRARRCPWLVSAGTPGSTTPDGPGAAPGAGGAWTAGALVRGSGRHCAGRGKAPARAWCRWGGVRKVSAVGRSLRSIRPPLAPALRAAKGVRPSALSPSPPGECQGGGPARRRARPPRQSTRRSPAWQRGQRNGQGSWPGCQLRLCRIASHGCRE